MSNKNRPAIFIPSSLNATLVFQTAAALEQSPIVYWGGDPSQGFGGYRSLPTFFAGQETYTVTIDSEYVQTPDLHMSGHAAPAPLYYPQNDNMDAAPTQDEITAYFINLFAKLKAIVEIAPDALVVLTPAPRRMPMPGYAPNNVQVGAKASQPDSRD